MKSFSGGKRQLKPVNKKLVFIRVDAGHKRGMGHLFRMINLSGVLSSMDVESLFLINEDEVLEQILSEKESSYMAYPSNTSEPEIIQDIFKNTKDLPSIWIYDILNTEMSWIKSIKAKDIKVVTFDDEKGGLQEADLVINSIVHSWGGYAKESINVPLLEGTAYAILQPSVFNLRKERVIGDEEFLKVGITMGGSDTHGSTLVILKSVLDILDNYKFHVFTGPHFLHQNDLGAIMDSIHLDILDISVKHAVPDLHLELDHMDVVICGGGITMYEACAMGLPVLPFANEDHEEKNIDFFLSVNACLPIGSINNIDYDEIGSKVNEYLANHEVLNQTARYALNCVTDGTLKCSESILSLL